jgi:hypothetical protein
MLCGRASSGYKNPNGGRGFPAYAQKRPGGYTIAFAAVASMATSNHIIFGTNSTLTDRNYVVCCVGFLTAVIAGVVIAD